MAKTITAYQSNRGNLFATEAEAKADDARGDLLDAFDSFAEAEAAYDSFSRGSMRLDLVAIAEGKTSGALYEFLQAAHDFIASRPIEPRTKVLKRDGLAAEYAKAEQWQGAYEVLSEAFEENTDYVVKLRSKHPTSGQAYEVLSGAAVVAYFTVYTSGKATTGGLEQPAREVARSILRAEGFTVKA